MSEKPKKRLVGWKQYLGTLGKKGVTHSLSYVVLAGGLTFLGLGILFFWASYCLLNRGQWWVLCLFLGVLTAALGVVLVRGAHTLEDSAQSIEQVELITRHNTGSLPEVETLVRGSESPLLDQQHELLRAARDGAETPSEELLRASEF